MSFEEHPECETPKDTTLKIWRYMDFTKFVSLLEEKALYFPNITTLADQFEGYFTAPTVKQFLTVPDNLSPSETLKRKRIGEYNLKMMKDARRLLYVSCWHMNNLESAAMWQLYLKHNEGIAVQSTIGKLIESVSQCEESVQIGAVKYIDYERDEIHWNNIFAPVMHKRLSYEHEKELRAVVLNPSYATGQLVRVDLNKLIEHVYVSPGSPSWIRELVQKVLMKYTNVKTVINSRLDERPIY